MKSHRIRESAHKYVLLLIENLSIMYFLTRNVPKNSLYLPNYLHCILFSEYTAWLFDYFFTSRRSSLLKEKCTNSVYWRFTAFLAPPSQRSKNLAYAVDLGGKRGSENKETIKKKK